MGISDDILTKIIKYVSDVHMSLHTFKRFPGLVLHVFFLSAAIAVTNPLANAGETFRDYLHLQFPNRADPRIGNTLVGCENSEHSNHWVKTDEHGIVLARCLPDTLYSWGSLAKIKWLEQLMGEGSWQTRLFTKPDAYLATVATPTGSFGYGPYSIRFKLKPGVKFIQGLDVVFSCKDLSDEERDTSVFLTTWGSGGFQAALEYIICSPAVVESWSYGTPEHYDEIVKDIEWIISEKHRYDYETYIRKRDASTGRYEPVYFGFSIDGQEFTAEKLLENLKNHNEMLQNHTGQLHVNPMFRRGHVLEHKGHFTSKWLVYFHDSQPE